jgi:hypothetical protein
MSQDQITALGGTLLRWGNDTWAWSDHSPAPQVRDMRPSWCYNFRCQGGFVEVPVKQAESEMELRWVAEGGYQTALSSAYYGERRIHIDGESIRETRVSQTGKAIPQVYLVPLEEWDNWDAEYVIGAKWDRTHEAAIFSKAESLGWKR